MTSGELKHQARLREWAAAVQDCRGSGLPVRQWCKQRGITSTTYYRWEREVLSATGGTLEKPADQAVIFAELPTPQQPDRNVPERSATLRIGDGSIDLYQELDPDLLRALVDALRSC